MDIITGYTGKPHVTSEQDRDINIGIFGSGSYVLPTGSQLAAEISSNNEIKIRDGVIMHQGCAASIKKNSYDSLTITNGSQGMKRTDLIVARYEINQDTAVESITLKVIQGTPAASDPTVPAHKEGDIQAGDAVVDMPLYHVQIDGLNITAVNAVFKNALDLQKTNESISKSGEMVLLGSTNKTTYQEFKKDLTPYKFFVLMTTIQTDGVLGSIIIPNSYIYKQMNANSEHNVIFHGEPNTYKGRLKFKQSSTDTFYLKNDGTVNQNFNTMVLYGVL